MESFLSNTRMIANNTTICISEGVARSTDETFVTIS